MKKFLFPLFSLAVCTFSGAIAVHAQSADGMRSDEVASTVATVSLPDTAVDALTSNFIAAVTTSIIDGKNKLVGFQGDFTFDERLITFQDPPVQKAGLTEGNWNVAGNILPGPGPIRTLRFLGYALDVSTLSGSGTLFELRMTRVSKAGESVQLTWRPPPHGFLFIDADLHTQKPGHEAPGSISPTARGK